MIHIYDCSNSGQRFIPSPKGDGSSLALHPDVINDTEGKEMTAGLMVRCECPLR